MSTTKDDRQPAPPPSTPANGSEIKGRIAIIEYSLIKAAVELETRAAWLRKTADSLLSIRESIPNDKLSGGGATEQRNK